MSEAHIFVEPDREGRILLVKATSVVQAWGVLRQDYPEGNFDYRGTVDEQIPQDQGTMVL